MGARFERYILDLLPALGLFPKASRHRIYRNGVEVGEVDILAVDGDGNTYAVEVKAGKIDITGIRQAYINAKLIGAKPLVIARGYAEEGARELARELGVEVCCCQTTYFFQSTICTQPSQTPSLGRSPS